MNSEPCHRMSLWPGNRSRTGLSVDAASDVGLSSSSFVGVTAGSSTIIICTSENLLERYRVEKSAGIRLSSMRGNGVPVNMVGNVQ